MADAASFAKLGLDDRLCSALAKQSITLPTLIQEKAIPLALSGKDILAKARTGSGKTLAYLLPVLHNLLLQQPDGGSPSVRVLILVPTKELSRQVAACTKEMLEFCPPSLRVLNVATDELSQVHRRAVVESEPSIVVSTPSRLCPLLDMLSLRDSLQSLVIDEADLVLSFGYEADLDRILAALPPILQTYLMSATVTTEVEALKGLILHSPVTLRLEDAVDQGDRLQQYSIAVRKPDDRFLLLYVILKLHLLRGKMLVFVNDVDRSFRVKLFLEQFHVKTCVLNAELPLSSRQHIVDGFNRGIYDILIASDVKQQHLQGNTNGEFSVARGVDFKRVDVVINFDLPDTPSAYVHRVGRTARAGASGTALSLVLAGDELEEERLRLIQADQLARFYGDLPAEMLSTKPSLVSDYAFDYATLDGFRYRCADALRAVTRAAIREARQQDLRAELLTSARLKTFLEERPCDIEALAVKRHDRLSAPRHVRPHLKHVPDYLLPHAPRASVGGALTVNEAAPTPYSLKSLPQAAIKPSRRSLKKSAAARRNKD